MEQPTKMPNSIEVFELIREFDKQAKFGRLGTEAAAELVEGYATQGDTVQELAARMHAAMHAGYASGCEMAARKLAALFGIERPEPSDAPADDD